MQPEPGESARRTRRSAADAEYRERLWVPWWWWLVAAVVAGVLAIELWLGVLPDFRLSLVIAGVLTAAALMWLSRTSIRLADGVLWAGGAGLPLRHVAGLEALDRRGTHRALGPEGDPTGFVVSRPWIGGSVRVILDPDDPADRTPYWLISTRRPTQLLQAVYDAARATGPGRPADGSAGPRSSRPPDGPAG